MQRPNANVDAVGGEDAEPLSCEDGSETEAEAAGSQPPAEEELDVDQIREDLQELREQWREDADARQWFYTRILGGAWTATHKKKLADAVAAFPRAGAPTRWCQHFHWPKQISFAYGTYGPEDAHRMANEFLARSTFFLLWYQSEDPLFRYSDADLESYSSSYEHLSWLTSLPLDSAALDRTLEIERLVPHN